MNSDELRRENHKKLLNCTDEQLDRFYEIVFEANCLGMNIDVDRFVGFIASESVKELWESGVIRNKIRIIN